MNRDDHQSRAFVVDAALLRELGERLIGRANIAVAELIKNAYDADATECTVTIDSDRIVVEDDGHGISLEEFNRHWATIGTTHKVKQKRSRVLKRPLTGSKGMGRLSVQFLAAEMELQSVSVDTPNKLLDVYVDWREVRRGSGLEEFEFLWDSRGLLAGEVGDTRSWTRLTLSGLKGAWDRKSIEDLGREVWFLQSPFDETSRSGAASSPDDFRIELRAAHVTDAKVAFDKLRKVLLDSWRAKIQGRIERGRREGRARVEVSFKAGYPERSRKGRIFFETFSFPIRDRGASERPLVDRATFQILIFKPEGRQYGRLPVQEMREYLAKFGNVSVYDAGFRLPYYGGGRDPAGQDWLGIAADQARRINASELLPEHLRTTNRYMQDLPALGRVFGAVQIDTNAEQAVAAGEGDQTAAGEEEDWLLLQPGRDRLADNDAFRQLRDVVRASIDFYANRYRLLYHQSLEQLGAEELPSHSYDAAVDVVEAHKEDMPEKAFNAVTDRLRAARTAARADERVRESQAVLLAPLATTGVTALALSHEFARETHTLQRASVRLRRLAEAHGIAELDAVAGDIEDLRVKFRSIMDLMRPLLSNTDMEATERLRARPVAEWVVSSMRSLMPRVAFDLSSLDADMRFPLGAFAEWSAILQNVLANAWNAMLESATRTVSLSGNVGARGTAMLRVSDSGAGLDVPITESHALFEPFERRLAISDDNRSVAIGGHGLGLSIVRMIAGRRGVTVRFVKPCEGFSTTIELTWRH